jgi:altronate dehydratase small subunit
MGLETVMKTRAMVLAPQDNVAIALTDLDAGLELDLRSEGHLFHVKLEESIPYQHKFSVATVRSGDEIMKDGVVIGVATGGIQPGQHVHVHNMTGRRYKPVQ